MSQRNATPYLFDGQTTSLCEECLTLVPAKIIVEGDNVYYLKRCAAHGTQKTLISSDLAYYRLCKDYLKPGDKPLKVHGRTEYGCPYDCGLCPDHEQHSCLAIIEVNDECNLRCPVCFAESSPNRTERRTLAEVERMLDTLVEAEGEADLVQISGGEPTLHPEILDILRLAKSKPIRHLMLNTNGVRLANDARFVVELAELQPGFEVYLQFDSLDDTAMHKLRGAGLSAVRRRALDNLEAQGISTTLVVTVKRGVNDGEIAAIIRHALRYSCVRGVTFQPIQDAGRNENFDAKRDRLLLTDIRREIAAGGLFTESDIIPLPCNPEAIAVGYALRQAEQVIPVTSLVPREILLESVPNTVAFEACADLKSQWFDFLSWNQSAEQSAEKLGQLLCCLPQVTLPQEVGYEHIFRVVIIQFMDRYNFCLGGVKRSCIHFVTPERQIIPFDTYNLFYRNGLVKRQRQQR